MILRVRCLHDHEAEVKQGPSHHEASGQAQLREGEANFLAPFDLALLRSWPSEQACAQIIWYASFTEVCVESCMQNFTGP